jgi:alpha-tubulin suppressor-like RCC1 family protein
MESTAEPVPVAGSLMFSSLDAGAVHTCGLTEFGDAHCWGYNKWAQLGGNAGDEMCGVSPCGTRPVLIAGTPMLASLNAGGLQSCGLTAEGTAYCWGANLAGELGSATASELYSAVPVKVEATVGFGAVTGGEHSECALSDGAAYCWGSNSHGQLGDGTLGTGGPTPVRVLTELRFAGVSAGMFHNCGTTLVGSILCWGGNRAGQLGNGTTAPSASPTPVDWPDRRP